MAIASDQAGSGLTPSFFLRAESCFVTTVCMYICESMMTRVKKRKGLDDGRLTESGGEISADLWRKPLGWLRLDCDQALTGWSNFGAEVEKSLDRSRSKSWCSVLVGLAIIASFAPPLRSTSMLRSQREPCWFGKFDKVGQAYNLEKCSR